LIAIFFSTSQVHSESQETVCRGAGLILYRPILPNTCGESPRQSGAKKNFKKVLALLARYVNFTLHFAILGVMDSLLRDR
jgi:hypothetical protein